MKAFKCDRCGKFYVLNFDQLKRRAEEDFYFKVVDNISEVDLCDKCFDELQEWMAVYKETESKK